MTYILQEGQRKQEPNRNGHNLGTQIQATMNVMFQQGRCVVLQSQNKRNSQINILTQYIGGDIRKVGNVKF